VLDRRAEKPLTDRNNHSHQRAGDLRYRHGGECGALHEERCTGLHFENRLRDKSHAAKCDEPPSGGGTRVHPGELLIRKVREVTGRHPTPRRNSSQEPGSSAAAIASGVSESVVFNESFPRGSEHRGQRKHGCHRIDCAAALGRRCRSVEDRP
jgi:hypothetical protein